MLRKKRQQRTNLENQLNKLDRILDEDNKSKYTIALRMN